MGLIIWLRKGKDSLKKFIFYLNLLLTIFLIIDFIGLCEKIITGKKTSPFKPFTGNLFLCDTCKKPDVFFIVLDEYSGSTGLRNLFSFDNNEFEKTSTAGVFYRKGESQQLQLYSFFDSIGSYYELPGLKYEGKGAGEY